MLLVPYSSTMAMMLWRMPVRMDATTIAAIIPMTIPSTVRKLRNLFPRTLSSAMPRVSRGKNFGNRNRILELSPKSKVQSPKPDSRRLCQRNNRIESGCFKRRINAGDHPDYRRDNQRQQNVPNGDRHCDPGQRGDQFDDAIGSQ